MLTAAEYRKRSRKTITLPSGGEIVIRKLSVSDFLTVGEVPLSFQLAVRSRDKEAVNKALGSDPALMKRLTEAAVINGVVSLKIVDKHPRDCDEDEISINEIDPKDCEFIVDEMSGLNNLKQEAGTSIRRFPEESGLASDPGCDGGEVRETADGDPVPQP